MTYWSSCLTISRGVGISREELLARAAAALFLVEDRLAEVDALAADVDVAGPFDQRADVAIALAAERTEGVLLGGSTTTTAACLLTTWHRLDSPSGFPLDRPSSVTSQPEKSLVVLLASDPSGQPRWADRESFPRASSCQVCNPLKRAAGHPDRVGVAGCLNRNNRRLAYSSLNPRQQLLTLSFPIL